ncbi:MAG: HAMP domain-containing sensor histidine kinase [Bacteroidales bacterium]
MSTNQGEFNNYNIADFFQNDENVAPVKENYSIIVVSHNEKLHEALFNTLRHFSLNGKGINIFKTYALGEARLIAQEFPEVVMVVIDDNIIVNGSFEVFVDFIKNELMNDNCLITFKSKLINLSMKKPDEAEQDQNQTGFFFARERLIDITRMVLLTMDMENKISEEGMMDQIDERIENFDLPEKSNTITREMLYTVLAHDLRAPIGNMKVILDFLTNEPDLLEDTSSKDLLCRVRESANSIHEMLEDYLFWGRMIKQDIYFHPRKIDLDQLIRENIMLLKTTAAEKEIYLQTNVAPNTEIYADEYMMTTVLRNLLYNAIKFTRSGGIIKITVTENTRHFEVNIIDNGIGIPEQNLGHLFRSDLYLTTKGTSKEKGAGLGLILCKDFIEKNGGTICVKSIENKGSEFCFTVPKWGMGFSH